MPQITEYTAPEGLGLRPSETGVESTAAAARRVGGTYSEAAQLTKEAGARIGSAIDVAGTQVVDSMARREISQGAAAFAGLMNAKTQQWHDTSTNADPNDPTVAQNFQQSVSADLDKFKSGFLTQKGQQWAEEHALKLQEHLFNKSTADRATAAGHAVAVNAKTTVNGLANAAFWDGTEKGLQTALSSLETSGLPKPVVEESKEVIIQRAAMGAIKQNAALPEWIKKPEYGKYVDGPTLAGLERSEKQQQTQNRVLERAARSTNEYTAKQEFNKQADTIYRDTLPVNNEARPQLPTDINDRLTKLQPNEDAPPAIHRAYRALINHVETISEKLNKPEPLSAVSHRTYMNLIGRIRSGEITDASEIDNIARPTAEHPNGLLNTSDYNSARKEFIERKTDQGLTLSKDRAEFANRIARSVDAGITGLGYRSALGDEQMHKLEADARIQEQALVKAGKDPHGVYDPNSPDYFGKPENLRRYAVTLQQIQQYEAAQQKGLPPPSVAPIAPPAAPAVRSMNDLPENVPTPGPDGNTYVRKVIDGVSKLFQVPAAAAKPTVPMSR